VFLLLGHRLGALRIALLDRVTEGRTQEAGIATFDIYYGKRAVDCC